MSSQPPHQTMENTDQPSSVDPTDAMVLEYLKKRGMTSAAYELEAKLKAETLPPSENEPKLAAFKRQLDQDELTYRSQRSVLSKVTGGGFGYDRDAAVPIIQWGIPDADLGGRNVLDGADTKLGKKLGVEEARSYIEAFTAIQLWVLSLPDDRADQSVQLQSNNPIQKAKSMMKDNKEVSLQSLVETMVNPGDDNESSPSLYHLPPSAKPELLSVTFALLVHTFCELLEVGMESTAHVLRDAFRPVYEPLYEKELRDLNTCQTTEDMMRLNQHNAQHMDALNSLKSKLVQIASLEIKRDELIHDASNSAHHHPDKVRMKLKEYDQTILVLKQKYNETSQRASASFDRMHDVPFLRRARAVRWQLHLSTMTYSLLANFLNNGIGESSGNSSLLAMSALLQSKCELHMEHRDPLPFAPACVIDENFGLEESQSKPSLLINWAAPVPKQDDEDKEHLPFPKYTLDEEYDDEKAAEADARSVEFNRAVLVNGFRRLEALERKRDFETMTSPSADSDDSDPRISNVVADPLAPSILLSTLCNNTGASATSSRSRTKATAAPLGESAAMWQESGVGLCCAEVCPPDGRRVAVGCDDSTVRIWNLLDLPNDGSTREPEQLLLGHKNGFPAFDVSWNRDGRSLLSAGGDGSVRLWDTMAQGPFGQVTSPKASSSKRPSASTGEISIAAAKEGLEKATAALARAKSGSELPIPSSKPESLPYKSGSALAVYRGHAPNTPVWSVAFAPCGYYFASTGGDSTARMWTTDRTVPVRLFSGHTSKNVNCVDFHPNCNYLLTGSDDRTCRLWDIQSGCCVRLLDGCGHGVNVVKVSSCGKYAAGGDHSGSIHLWDLGTGKKVTEYRPPDRANSPHNRNTLHALSFSACGAALAAGGDDCCVRVWDVKKSGAESKPVTETPTKTFPTRRSMILDLQFTKRNLLLSAGKFVTPIPVTIPSD